MSVVFDNPYRPAPGSLPPELAGREPQISAAHYASGLTRTGGAAQPILFTGLRGMGKTALLRHSVSAAEELGAVVLYTEASTEMSLAQPYDGAWSTPRRNIRRSRAR